MLTKVVQKLNANYEDNWDVIPNYFVDQDPYEWRNLKKIIGTPYIQMNLRIMLSLCLNPVLDIFTIFCRFLLN